MLFGLGLNDGGLGMAKYFLNKGAILTITDGKTAEILTPSIQKLEKYKNITYHLGGHIEKDFIDADFIVRNPSVRPSSPFLQLAQKLNKPILMEIPLFMKLAPCQIIGITGTKGKSTTTNLIYKLLKSNLSKDIYLAGNIGKSAIQLLPKLKKPDLVVLELSSFQLDSFDFGKKSPRVAVLTNLKNDHVDWHGSLQDYHKAKLNIFKYQTKNDYAIVNYDDPYSKSQVSYLKSNVVSVSIKNNKANYYFDGQQVWENQKVLFKLHTKLFLATNILNILEAVAVARLYKVSSVKIQKSIARHKNLPGRLEYLGQIKGVDVYNDTCATNPEAVKTNLISLSHKYGKNIVLLAGGMDKLFDFDMLKDPILDHTKHVVLFEGTGSQKIKEILDDTNHPVSSFFNTMPTGFKEALNKCVRGDCLVLSPGATSFNMFNNEFDRGTQFNAEFKKY